jgi:NhaP-type Na+/H+ or K+/H+ antiporter
MTDDQIIIGFTTIVAFGVGSQWIARRLGFPSLLLLLPAGLIAGGTGLVDPELLFGESLFPVVTLLVALLLFQSGLDLHLDDLPGEARKPVLRLVTIGMAITFAGATGVLLVATDIPTEVAFVMGAILTVSGPTVVGPVLRVIRPRAPTGAVLSWEGTVLDPLGATLGVVVLNLVLASTTGGGIHPLLQMLSRLGLGATVGLAGAAVLVFVLSRFFVTDDMEAAVAVLVAVLCFGIAETLLSEAGLFATVTLGVVIANQRLVPTARIKGFGQTLEVLIIGTLFIVLGALVDFSQLVEIAGPIAIVVALLILVVRPVSVFVSQLRSSLSMRDRGLVAWMDPRGIVAAATAAQFSPLLADAGFDSSLMLPMAFGVILGVGVVYAVTGKPVAAALGLSLPRPTGVALVGARAWLLELARNLQDLGVSVLVFASQRPDDLSESHLSLPMVSTTDDADELRQQLSSAVLGSAVVATDRTPVSDLVVAALVESLGRRHVYVAPSREEEGVDRLLREAWTNRPFGPGVTIAELDRRVDEGAEVRLCHGELPAGAIPMAVVGADGSVDLQPGMRSHVSDGTLVALVGGEADGPRS